VAAIDADGLLDFESDLTTEHMLIDNALVHWVLIAGSVYYGAELWVCKNGFGVWLQEDKVA
jgi:hypothetical protein